ncbi:collagen alpha-1(I) chain-like [Choloepus didactylus]|uniref:collagen alpha-1(I) chain-like n=1 Tax=Choloepus didactylus TaxID=27675 RepID=UPI00189DA4D7|nr:collagen alpha-1(I) chain-like [Choloepus didactylus]
MTQPSPVSGEGVPQGRFKGDRIGGRCRTGSARGVVTTAVCELGRGTCHHNASPALREGSWGHVGGTQPTGGSGQRSPLPRSGPGVASGLGCAEEAASRARGGGRGGPGITWAEAGPAAPGGRSPEPGRRRRQQLRKRRPLLASPPSLPSRDWPPSPTGERQPGERAHLRTLRPAPPGARGFPRPRARPQHPAPRAPSTPLCTANSPSPCSAPRGLGLPGPGAAPPAPGPRVLWPRSIEGGRTGRAGPDGLGTSPGPPAARSPLAGSKVRECQGVPAGGPGEGQRVGLGKRGSQLARDNADRPAGLGAPSSGPGSSAGVLGRLWYTVVSGPPQGQPQGGCWAGWWPGLALQLPARVGSWIQNLRLRKHYEGLVLCRDTPLGGGGRPVAPAGRPHQWAHRLGEQSVCPGWLAPGGVCLERRRVLSF